mgnify:CR=1 FL=1
MPASASRLFHAVHAALAVLDVGVAQDLVHRVAQGHVLFRSRARPSARVMR